MTNGHPRWRTLLTHCMRLRQHWAARSAYSPAGLKWELTTLLFLLLQSGGTTCQTVNHSHIYGKLTQKFSICLYVQSFCQICAIPFALCAIHCNPGQYMRFKRLIICNNIVQYFMQAIKTLFLAFFLHTLFFNYFQYMCKRFVFLHYCSLYPYIFFYVAITM